MTDKNKKGGDVKSDEKRSPDEELKHENLNLATEKEEVFKRIQMLNEESQILKSKYKMLITEKESLQ